tara:strand:- start:1407 stop:2375 length:969 start_codon:yes stop_codon:yes gene_type:complete
MYKNKSIGVSIPCFKTGKITIDVVNDILEYVDYVVLVDDNCPYETGKLVENAINSTKLYIIKNDINSGVGASTKKGFEWLLKKECDLILKIDGDGQMNASDIPKMYIPILQNECDATKGNRFTNMNQLKNMPKLRLLGNIFLSFISKFSTGYWELFDPTNGFIALDGKVLAKLPLNKIDNRFFFETDLLFRCGINNVAVKNVSVDINYNKKNSACSSLNAIKEIPHFLTKHFFIAIKRIAYQYFIFNFNPGSLDLLISFFFSIIALLVFIISILMNDFDYIFNSSITLLSFLISVLIAVKFYISFIYYDCSNNILSRKYENH